MTMSEEQLNVVVKGLVDTAVNGWRAAMIAEVQEKVQTAMNAIKEELQQEARIKGASTDVMVEQINLNQAAALAEHVTKYENKIMSTFKE